MDRTTKGDHHLADTGHAPQHNSRLYHGWYNEGVLLEIRLNDIVRMRKPHPCGNYDWKIVRLGADIGLECTKCSRRVLLTRRELSNRLKKIISQEDHGLEKLL